VNIFGAAAEALQSHFDSISDTGHGSLSECKQDAGGLLAALGYAPGSAELAADPGILKNRQRLLDLASKFDDAFELPMPDAQGAFFLGAKVNPTAFGIAEHGNKTVGVGGRGLTRQRAFESCVGEAAEYLSFIERTNDQLVASFPGAHGLKPDELTWAFIGIGVPEEQRPDTLDWIGAESLTSGRSVLFPAELVLRRPAGRRAGNRQAQSNGLGAGANLNDAILSGLMEVVERDAIALWWNGGRTPTAVPDDLLDNIGFKDLARAIRFGSSRTFWLLDITTDLDIPVVVAVSSAEDGAAVVTGFSAHPNIGSAIWGAFLEMCQMELAQKLSVMKFKHGGIELRDKDLAWIDRYNRLTLQAFPELVTAGIPRDQCTDSDVWSLEDALGRLSNRGYEPLCVDVTRKSLGIDVVKILVPGLQSADIDWPTSRLVREAKQNGKPIKKSSNTISLI